MSSRRYLIIFNNSITFTPEPRGPGSVSRLGFLKGHDNKFSRKRRLLGYCEEFFTFKLCGLFLGGNWAILYINICSHSSGTSLKHIFTMELINSVIQSTNHSHFLNYSCFFHPFCTYHCNI